MSDIIMISPEVSKLITSDKEIKELVGRLNDFLCTTKLVYEYNILYGTFNRVFTEEQTVAINSINELIDLRKQQIISLNK